MPLVKWAQSQLSSDVKSQFIEFVLRSISNDASNLATSVAKDAVEKSVVGNGN